MPTLPVCSARLIYIIFLNEACAKDVGYITSHTCRHIHGRLVKGLRASAAHRNPCNRIFWGDAGGCGREAAMATEVWEEIRSVLASK